MLWMLLACGPVASETDTAPLPGPEPGWSRPQSLLVPLQEHAVVAWEGEIVVLGGFDDRGVETGRVEAYDPASDTWRSLPDFPVPMHHAQAAVIDGELFVLGLLESFRFEESGVVWRFDGTSWSEGAAMATEVARGAGAAAVVDGRIHVVGGLQGGDAVGLHSAYDPVADAWEELAPMSVARDHLVAGAADGKLYAIGGRDGSIRGVYDDVEVFDPASGVWTAGTPMPTARGGCAAAVVDGRILVFGGEGNRDDESGVFPQTEAYDPVTDTWVELEDMPEPRHGMGAAGLDGIAWVPGGATVQAFGAVGTFEAFRP